MKTGLFLVVACACLVFGQVRSASNPGIVAAIESIKAIDNHCHPEQALNEGETDTQWDSLPADGYKQPRVQYIPANVRPRNPMIVASWRALWGISDREWSEGAVKRAMENKHRIRKQKGDSYPAWVLDKAGVDIALSNRITMQRGLKNARFRWVPYGDLYLFPLSTSKLQAENPLYARFYAGLEKEASALAAPPPTLKEWIASVMVPNLERQKREGAVAVKFIAAYYRQLDFVPVKEQTADAIYASYVQGGAPGTEQYKQLQDYIFYQVAHEAARLQMPVHLHTGVGWGAQYSVAGANPFLLEKAFLHVPETDFVLLHGSFPFSPMVTGLLNKSNVFVDFSAAEYFLTPRNLANTLRFWMDYMPEKVLFGTDSYPNPALPQASWEEFEWVNTRLARQALALALTEMMNDGQITMARAKELANMVMRENCAKLHHLE